MGIGSSFVLSRLEGEKMAAREDLSDKMKPQVYIDPRPAEYFDKFHQRSRQKEPDFVYELVRVIMVIFTKVFFRVKGYRADNIPLSGPVILAPNHASNIDHFFTGRFTRRQVRFMAKSNMFKRPMQWIYSHGGVFPVRRGLQDEEAFITAKTILSKGGLVLMYPQGGRSRSGSIHDATAKRGVGRLALETGVPIIPVAILNSERVRNWRRGEFPKVHVMYGERLCFAVNPDATIEDQQAVADKVMEAIKKLHSDLSWKVDGFDVGRM